MMTSPYCMKYQGYISPKSWQINMAHRLFSWVVLDSYFPLDSAYHDLSAAETDI